MGFLLLLSSFLYHKNNNWCLQLDKANASLRNAAADKSSVGNSQKHFWTVSLGSALGYWNSTETGTTGIITSLLFKNFTCFLSGSSTQYWPLLHRHLHIALTPFFLLSASLLVHDWLSPTCPFPICLTMSVPHTPSYQVYPLHNHTSLTPSLPENSTSNNSRPQLVGG